MYQLFRIGASIAGFPCDKLPTQINMLSSSVYPTKPDAFERLVNKVRHEKSVHKLAQRKVMEILKHNVKTIPRLECDAEAESCFLGSHVLSFKDLQTLSGFMPTWTKSHLHNFDTARKIEDGFVQIMTRGRSRNEPFLQSAKDKANELQQAIVDAAHDAYAQENNPLETSPKHTDEYIKELHNRVQNVKRHRTDKRSRYPVTVTKQLKRKLAFDLGQENINMEKTAQRAAHDAKVLYEQAKEQIPRGVLDHIPSLTWVGRVLVPMDLVSRKRYNAALEAKAKDVLNDLQLQAAGSAYKRVNPLYFYLLRENLKKLSRGDSIMLLPRGYREPISNWFTGTVPDLHLKHYSKVLLDKGSRRGFAAAAASALRSDGGDLGLEGTQYQKELAAIQKLASASLPPKTKHM